MEFRYSKSALRDLAGWKKSGQTKVLEKIGLIQLEIAKDPFATHGSYGCEQLRFELVGWYSRQITKKDRYVYRPHPTEKDVVEVIQCRGHYGDR